MSNFADEVFRCITDADMEVDEIRLNPADLSALESTFPEQRPITTVWGRAVTADATVQRGSIGLRGHKEYVLSAS